jgi:hypothetical protein
MYGSGTRSYNRSAEARENKRLQREATERYEAGRRNAIALDTSWLMCSCCALPHKHPAHPYREIIRFAAWFRWRGNVEGE